jgi:ankyrin repeat protein
MAFVVALTALWPALCASATMAPMSENTVGGRIALIEAAKAGSLEGARAALGAGSAVDQPDPLGRTALHYAARLGHTGIVDLLLEAGSPAGATDSDGYTPLIRAVEFGHVESARALLAAGANPDIPLPDGRTARSIAEASGNEALMDVFEGR